jgi:hypothetical protein
LEGETELDSILTYAPDSDILRLAGISEDTAKIKVFLEKNLK